MTQRSPAGAETGAIGRGRFDAELEALRERMRCMAFSGEEMAAEIARRCRVRPREAYRLASGWTLEQAAARFNSHAARPAGLTGPILGEYEQWPRSTRRPSVDALLTLAEIYGTDVSRLLDLADHESLPQHDRLTLLRRPAVAGGFGERVSALLKERGLAMREIARRVPCSAGYLSNVVHGRKRPSDRVAARLDEVLDANGELIALAKAAEAIRPPGDRPVAPGRLGKRAPGLPMDAGEGMSLWLPYVPGRLVIEVSGPETGSRGLTVEDHNREITSRRLALVRDATPPG